MYQLLAKVAKRVAEKLSFSLNPKTDSVRTLRKQSGLDYQSFEERRLLAGIEFTPSTGQVLIGGTDANDVAQVTQSGNTIRVTQQGFGSRTFNAAEVNSIFFVGLRGNDFFQNQTSIDSIAYGQVGNDTLIGGSGNDRLVGNGENDTIRGNGGDDVIIGGNGNDQIDAGAGNDRVLGVAGSNTIEGGTGNDTIYGGNDADTITDIGGTNLLVGNNGTDTITGGDGPDNIFGGGGNDVIIGGAGNDRIYSQGGNDSVSGGAGDDVVGGNDGNDVLQGEQGNDRVVGGAGNDRVNFSANLSSYDVRPSGADLIIEDLRGPNFGLTDLVIGVEEFAFADGVRSRDDLLNPSEASEVITVQPIIASNSNGSNAAEFFGNATQQLDIMNRIDVIFAQADIDVEFLPAKRVNDTFINVGNGGTRPGSDLNQIVTSGDNSGLGNPDSRVIDMYFVETVPGFGDLGDNVANGLAFIGISGIAMHVGDDLVDSTSGRAVVARVAAHEIGHNLGLRHVAGNNNLLAQSGSSTLLTQSQIAIAIASPISRPV